MTGLFVYLEAVSGRAQRPSPTFIFGMLTSTIPYDVIGQKIKPLSDSGFYFLLN